MEIQQARVRLPLLDGPPYSSVVQRGPPAEPPSQTLLRADIVTREDMETAKTSKEHVLSRPSADPAQLTKPRGCPLIAVTCQAFDVNLASVDSTSEGEQRMDFLPAEPDRVIACGRDARDIACRWKRILSVLAGSTSHVAHRGQPIEQLETNNQ